MIIVGLVPNAARFPATAVLSAMKRSTSPATFSPLSPDKAFGCMSDAPEFQSNHVDWRNLVQPRKAGFPSEFRSCADQNVYFRCDLLGLKYVVHYAFSCYLPNITCTRAL